MKEGSNSRVCRVSCPLTLAVPNLCFLCVLQAECVGGTQRWLGWLLQPALGMAVCWQRPLCAVVEAGLDRPPLCPVSQHPAAKGSGACVSDGPAAPQSEAVP